MTNIQPFLPVSPPMIANFPLPAQLWHPLLSEEKNYATELPIVVTVHGQGLHLQG